MKKEKSLENVRFVMLAVLLTLAMALPCAAAIRQSANKVYNSAVTNGGQFALTGYLYYSNDTAESITCDYFGFSCKNTSTVSYYNVNFAQYNAFNGEGVGNNRETLGDQYDDSTFTGVAPGVLASHKSPHWSTVQYGRSNVYEKKGNPAIFEVLVGCGGYDNAIHQFWCYPDLSYETKSIF